MAIISFLASRLKDINVWAARLYSSGGDGFYVLWYSDIDSLRDGTVQKPRTCTR
ncbi:MAG: hypothetical protein FWG10_03885 [Eubacteriaceae bacterium]|nr:hypothetical protein [Eubacteriaceae bacterium]